MSGCRVALVNPSFSGSFQGAPLCLAYLGAALEQAGHKVKIFDFWNDPLEGQAQLVADWRPALVGVTGTSPSFWESLRFAQELRKLDKDAWIVKGGHHERGDTCTESLMGNFGIFDFAVSAAHGEIPLVHLANERASDKLLKDVILQAGIYRRARTGRGFLPEAAAPHAPSHLLPARHLLDRTERYEYRGIFDSRKATQMLTYRGCLFQCSFCAIDSFELKHDLDCIAEDIRTIKSSGHQAVFLDDATFTRQWHRAEQIAELLHTAGLGWACQTRIDCVKIDQLKIMRELGCEYIYYGLESGSSRVLEAINKKQQHERTIKIIEETRKLGMKAVTSFIFGVPLSDGQTESKEDWERSVDLIRMANPTYVVPSIFAYYPQSPAWNRLSYQERAGYSKEFGVNRQKAWNWFDDGYGAIHHVTLTKAQEIRYYLERKIPEYLWTDASSSNTPI